MKHLLLIAHGSRRDASNVAVQDLADVMRGQAGAEWNTVGCAFLELGEPSIPDAIDSAIANGADELVVVPYFLAPGKHVAKHIPDIIADKRKQYPQVNVRLTQWFGTAPRIPGLLLDLANDK